jgi:hypothetical protein
MFADTSVPWQAQKGIMLPVCPCDYMTVHTQTVDICVYARTTAATYLHMYWQKILRERMHSHHLARSILENYWGSLSSVLACKMVKHKHASWHLWRKWMRTLACFQVNQNSALLNIIHVIVLHAACNTQTCRLTLCALCRPLWR